MVLRNRVGSRNKSPAEVDKAEVVFIGVEPLLNMAILVFVSRSWAYFIWFK